MFGNDVIDIFLQLQKTKDSITNESRLKVKDKRFAKFRASELYDLCGNICHLN